MQRPAGASSARDALRRAASGIALIDHHAHSVLRTGPDRAGFEDAMTEAHERPPAPATAFDSQLGFALRRHCAPVLGLEPFAPAQAYLARRAELGAAEATRRLLAASGIGLVLLDHGYAAERLLTPAEFTTVTGVPTRPVVRLEAVAEEAFEASRDAHELVRAIDARLEAASATATAWKTIAAYRTGLALDPAPPGDGEVRAAAADWIATGDRRLRHPVLVRHLIWWALSRGGALQVHTGFGDPDLLLADANPLHLQPLIARATSTGSRIALLHCHPFEREAAFLCHAFGHVVMDVGLAVPHLGAQAPGSIRQALGLAPLHAVLFSTDAWGLPELYLLGSRLWRDAIVDVLGAHVEAGEWTLDDAVRVIGMIGRGNAERTYGLSTEGERP
ncbi:amidohydrolase [Microbacterium thalassium]|uniref:Putative TIM-barrel fold metal-dependent hydrolase n=1 Tax=Microbacterium thalassium TaxID=362649 RepID=A0A7X0KW24_9MICO|nr:amidohydrolase [Microbacterium thalassium]MBB6392793.1 putative TIM-barrel fold metal-dependent hydrolase [Microbacterium thalassium]GLK22976.1 amidohydrolase [Microbacterium thalassium]